MYKLSFILIASLMCLQFHHIAYNANGSAAAAAAAAASAAVTASTSASSTSQGVAKVASVASAFSASANKRFGSRKQRRADERAQQQSSAQQPAEAEKTAAQQLAKEKENEQKKDALAKGKKSKKTTLRKKSAQSPQDLNRAITNELNLLSRTPTASAVKQRIDSIKDKVQAFIAQLLSTENIDDNVDPKKDSLSAVESFVKALNTVTTTATNRQASINKARTAWGEVAEGLTPVLSAIDKQKNSETTAAKTKK